MTRAELKQDAKKQLRGNWGWAVLLSFVSWLIIYLIEDIGSFISSGKDTIVAYIDSFQHSLSYTTITRPNPLGNVVNALLSLLIGVIIWGVTYTILQFRDKGDKPNIFQGIFSGYTHGHFESTFLTYLVYEIFLFLWGLLLIIPGIVKSYSYAMTPYILKDKLDSGQIPSATDAITESRFLMNGHKAELFVLDLSFIGWSLLGIITIGIGFLWIIPYYRQTKANFYRNLAGERYRQ